MKSFKFSLIDNDNVVQAHTGLNLNDEPGASLREFLGQIKEELITGASAYFEIQDADNKPIVFSISQAE